MSNENLPDLGTFTVSVSTTDLEHEAAAVNPAQMLLPGMEPTAEEALDVEPVLPAVDDSAEPSDVIEPEEAAFEPADLSVEAVVAAVECADEVAFDPSEFDAADAEPDGSEPEVVSSEDDEPASEVEAIPAVVAEETPVPEPEPAVTEPSAEAVDPAVPVVQPVIESAEPEPVVSELAEPVVAASEPVVAAAEPVIGKPWSKDTKPVESHSAVAESVPATVAAPDATVETPDSSSIDADESAAPVAEVEVTAETSGFAKLNLHEDVLAAVVNQGYQTPTEVQARIIPHMLEGRDVLAQSQTGTGKTAAFALPVLSRVQPGQRKPQVLVLAPTRELAMQVASAFQSYGSQLNRLQVAAIYGGADYGPQIRQLSRGVDVVVGTPGRVIDHIKRDKLDLSELSCLVLDEADEMLKMGFLEDVQFVLEQTPGNRQVALFSATLPPAIRGIAQHYLNDPARVTIKTKTMTAESIRQRAIFTVGREKLKVLQRILEVEETDGVIVFVKTKESTISVAEELCRDGLSAVAINGDMPQKVRERTIRQFKNSRLDILVATDVAARGLDVDRVSHVFNYDLPHGNDSYVHRIGRTGRAGRTGEAIIFLTRSERGKLRSIERTTRQPIEIVDSPTAQEINEMRIQRYKERINKTVESADLTFFNELLQSHAAETGLPMETIAAAVAQMGLGRKPFFLKKDKPKKKFERSERDDKYSDRKPRSKGKRERESGPPEPGMARYRIAVGWRDGVKPGNIVGAIANEAGIDGKAIGHINIQHSFTTIDLAEDMPKEIQQQLYHTRVVGRQMRLGLESEHQGTGGGKSGQSRGPKKFSGKKYSKGKSSGFAGNKKRKFKKS